MEMSAKYTHDDFPAPRNFEFTNTSREYKNIHRYLEVAKAKEQKPSKKKWLVFAAFVVVIMILILGDPKTFGYGGVTASFSLDPVIAASETSTPKYLWRQGEMPHLYQTDPEWSDDVYGEGTMETHGCGPTALSMAYVYLTGKKDIDPAQMAAFSMRNGFVDSGVTSWTLMSKGARMLGLRSEEIAPDVELVTSKVRSGKPVVCIVGPGDFTTDGHFIVICGVDEQGDLFIRDPNSQARSSQRWEAKRVLSQCKNLWAISV